MKKNNVGVYEIKLTNKDKGITLIALIITIIVMLILVGVSISIALNTGLFESAGKATQEWESKQEEEAKLAGGVVNIDGVLYDSIEDYLKEVENSSGNIKIKLGMVSTPETVIEDGIKVKELKDGAPIPVGFYYVGGTMNTGIVISDNSADENAGENADLQGNQFVWVPVIQNQKLKIEIESKEQITGVKIEDALHREITTDKNGNIISPTGTSYTLEINPTINGVYTITVTAGEETEVKMLNTTSLYGQQFYIKTKEERKKVYTLEEFTEDYSDDGIVVEEWLEEDYGTTSLEEAYELAIQEEYDDEIIWLSKFSDSTIATYSNSVNTYGGFYIARYEAGSDNIRTETSGTTDTVYSKKNKYPYNYINQENAIILSQGMDNGKTSVTSELINSAAWDRTLNWLTETKAITTNEMFIDSTSWGNYKRSTFDFIGEYSLNMGETYTNSVSSIPKPGNVEYLLGTGVSNYTKRNNIYDLAGNCWEWTTENYDSNKIVRRGGNYKYYDVPACERNNISASFSEYGQSFRSVLYIN